MSNTFSRCDKCGDIQLDIDVGFSLALQGMKHTCGGTYVAPCKCGNRDVERMEYVELRAHRRPITKIEECKSYWEGSEETTHALWVGTSNTEEIDDDADDIWLECRECYSKIELSGLLAETLGFWFS